MPKFNVQQCPVCDNNNFLPFITSTDFFVTGEKFNLKKCTSCGFIVTENIEDEANIGRYYQSEEYISHSNTSKGLVNAVYHRVRNYMLKRKRRLVEKATGMRIGSLLDVGTGTGYFINEMNHFGWKVTGIEKSVDARKFAEKEFDLKIQQPDELFKIHKNSFHVITLWHVLEHIQKLEDNLISFSQLLKPEGKLIIAVPNPTSYDAKHYREYWAAYDVPRHIWHFGPEQMKRFGEKHGFKLIRTAPMPFDSFYVSMLSERYKKSKAAFIKGMFHGKISWLKSLINTKRCSSIIYVFEKN